MPLTVYTTCPINWGATAFYRFLQPLTFMQRAGLALPWIDYGESHITPQLRAQAMSFSDIHWRYQDPQAHFQTFIEEMHKAGPFWRTEDRWEPPVNMVLDTDDDMFNLTPLNQGPFQRLGTRYMGKELEPGFEIGVEGSDGEKKVLWKDGKNINLQANLARMRQYRHNLSIASMVTVASEGMKKAVLREAPNANVFINPNCIDFEDYPKIELASHEPTVRILWQGGDSHLNDMLTIRDSLTKILKKYPFVELVIWGAQYAHKEWPAEQVRYEGWRPYQEYKLRLNQMNHDIALAPLTNEPFNFGKSAIKVYESASCYKPAPTVAANIGPYTEFDDGVTAMLYNTIEEFEAKLSELIENSALRKLMGQSCKDWVATYRSPMPHAVALAEAFENLRLTRREAYSEPPRPEPPKEPDAESLPANDD